MKSISNTDIRSEVLGNLISKRKPAYDIILQYYVEAIYIIQALESTRWFFFLWSTPRQQTRFWLSALRCECNSLLKLMIWFQKNVFYIIKSKRKLRRHKRVATVSVPREVGLIFEIHRDVHTNFAIMGCMVI